MGKSRNFLMGSTIYVAFQREGGSTINIAIEEVSNTLVSQICTIIFIVNACNMLVFDTRVVWKVQVISCLSERDRTFCLSLVNGAKI
jgi:hypothetical protein